MPICIILFTSIKPAPLRVKWSSGHLMYQNKYEGLISVSLLRQRPGYRLSHPPARQTSNSFAPVVNRSNTSDIGTSAPPVR